MQHRLEGFDCGKPALNDWLLRHARQAQGSGSAKTFVVADGDDRVAGYFSLTVGQVDTLEAPERIRKGIGQYPVPVVILARLAVSREHHGRGIGVGMLQDAIRRTLVIAEQAGVRAMLTRPIDEDAARFYNRFGFIASPLREQITIQVEVETLAQLREALQAGAVSVLLDNFSPQMMRDAVAINQEVADGVALLEVSGGVTLDQLRGIAETGVDYISIGAMTKDVKAVDLSMRLSL